MFPLSSPLRNVNISGLSESSCLCFPLTLLPKPKQRIPLSHNRSYPEFDTECAINTDEPLGAGALTEGSRRLLFDRSGPRGYVSIGGAPCTTHTCCLFHGFPLASSRFHSYLCITAFLGFKRAPRSAFSDPLSAYEFGLAPFCVPNRFLKAKPMLPHPFSVIYVGSFTRLNVPDRYLQGLP